MTLLSLKAQECSSLWLSCNNADKGQHVLYSHTYTDFPKLSDAKAILATDGYFRLYINGTLVSYPPYPFVRAPYRENADKTHVIPTVLDISRYVVSGSNTISVLCSPSDPALSTGFSLRFIGTTQSGDTLSFDAGRSWLYRPVEGKMLDYHAETQTGLNAKTISELQDKHRIMSWLPAELSYRSLYFEIKPYQEYSYEYVSKIIRAASSYVDIDKKGVTFDFASGFYGQIRVTLRDTKPGQKIYIAGSEYICKGKWDEQFILHFASSWFKKVHISGGNDFLPNQIVKVEGLQIVPKRNNYFSF